MACISARRVIQRSTSSFKSVLTGNQPRTISGGPSALGGHAAGIPTAVPCPSRRCSSFIRRLPAELGCVESLMPLHSRTASSLLKSKLSTEVGKWGFLSEGFATTL
ncbi:PREDICTED: protein NUCLEAR FUSION DEFECTIVE 6, chloroplastic/mitochondrial-like [Ipomoea nil]|uniref:protein NUCLEAR FUSION DEFECTIVE 6, chloroplastic/mitochondrial-like n=1 Tax=Ipomoea nil TaxID=35883 RepID=UPI000901BA17|nr:PREDICTED: protein NUCLEAR FUSION DEFECTIVE 6, chloroplastic/mitochondrial-like [Ipomoea nil]